MGREEVEEDKGRKIQQRDGVTRSWILSYTNESCCLDQKVEKLYCYCVPKVRVIGVEWMNGRHAAGKKKRVSSSQQQRTAAGVGIE